MNCCLQITGVVTEAEEGARQLSTSGGQALNADSIELEQGSLGLESYV